MAGDRGQNRLVLIGIMLAVLLWGAFHAVGAFGYNGNPWRAVVVMACVGGFLGLWLCLLALRRSRGNVRPPR